MFNIPQQIRPAFHSFALVFVQRYGKVVESLTYFVGVVDVTESLYFKLLVYNLFLSND